MTYALLTSLLVRFAKHSHHLHRFDEWSTKGIYILVAGLPIGFCEFMYYNNLYIRYVGYLIAVIGGTFFAKALAIGIRDVTKNKT